MVDLRSGGSPTLSRLKYVVVLAGRGTTKICLRVHPKAGIYRGTRWCVGPPGVGTFPLKVGGWRNGVKDIREYNMLRVKLISMEVIKIHLPAYLGTILRQSL